jgi:hypothetical protein
MYRNEPIACLSRHDGRMTWAFTSLIDAQQTRSRLRAQGDKVSPIRERTLSVDRESHLLYCIVIGTAR